MRIWKKREVSYQSFVDQYHLCDVCIGQTGVPIGVLLLYLFANSRDFNAEGITAEVRGYIDEEKSMLHFEADDAGSTLGSLHALAKVFQEQHLYLWELRGTYRNTEVVLSGKSYDTIVVARTPLNFDLDLVPWVNEIEARTYEYQQQHPTEQINAINRFARDRKMAAQVRC